MLKTFISHEKFVFSGICPEKSILKPSEIAVFTLKITCFGYKNRPLWTMLISELEIFLKMLVDNLISLQKLFIFLKNHSIWLTYACFCFLSSISESEIESNFDPNFGPKTTPIFFFIIEIIKDCLKHFTWEICVSMNILRKKSIKTIRNSCFYQKNRLFWVWNWAIMDQTHL